MPKLLFVLMLLMPPAVFAQSAFSGTWHFSADSAQFSGKPMTISLQKGMYRCDSCVPKLDVKADGNDHERKGSPYADMVSVRVVDDHTVEVVSKKAGKVVSTTKDAVSADGKTLTSEWSFVADNGQEGHGKTVSNRVAAGAEGAHAVSGSWQAEKVDNASDSVLTVTFTAADDGLSMTDPTGDSYSAKFDGKDSPYKGDPGITSVSLKRIDANTIEETDKRNGKAISVTRMTVSADGQTIALDNKDLLRGTTSKFTGKKQ